MRKLQCILKLREGVEPLQEEHSRQKQQHLRQGPEAAQYT